MKNILLPTDFSPNSLQAIDYALQFCKGHTCSFYVLHVQKSSDYITDDLMSSAPNETVFESIARDNKKKIDLVVKQLKDKYPSQDYTFYSLFDFDDLVSAIEQAVQLYAIDLIVMGTNGATGAEEVIFGSNTLRVIREIDCPTLTVPDHYTYRGINTILFSIRPNTTETFKSMKLFRELLKMHSCQLKVLELYDDPTQLFLKEEDASIKNLFPEHPYSYYSLFAFPGVTAVTTATQLLKADLHAVFVEKETFLERFLVGSDTSNLVYKTLVPLLFLHT